MAEASGQTRLQIKTISGSAKIIKKLLCVKKGVLSGHPFFWPGFFAGFINFEIKQSYP